jgi:pimeloyl-ACP methyl ester carboxylesterase
MIDEFGGRWPQICAGAEDDCTITAGLPVVALHCSGADGRQWRKLADSLSAPFNLIAIESYGCESTGHWTGEHAFTLADEADRVIGLIDRLGVPVHLVGHSYGGGVALRVAVERPDAIASLALYEPSAFHLLTQLGPDGLAAREEILRLTHAVSCGVISGDYQGAITCFVDYWNGAGAAALLQPHARAALLRWLPKAPLDFRALLEERVPLATYRQLAVPTLVLRGEHGPEPSRLIAEGLTRVMRFARLKLIAGAGHMGPFSHAAEVNAAIAAHVQCASAAGNVGSEPLTQDILCHPDRIAA